MYWAAAVKVNIPVRPSTQEKGFGGEKVSGEKHVSKIFRYILGI